MYNFHLVGAGSLGSGIAIEISRRLAALTWPAKLVIYDDDTVEERNIFSQDFLPSDIGKAKAEAVAEKCAQYNFVEVEWQKVRVVEDNINKIMELDPLSIIIDAVDNIEARHLLWYHTLATGVPVMHMGMTPEGAGLISWTCETHHDSFNLSPMNMTAESIKQLTSAHDNKMPPCELNGFRSLILNTVLAGVNSLFIAIGKDSLKEIQIDGELQESPGTLTTWNTHMRGFELNPQITAVVPWPKSEEELFILEAQRMALANA